MSMAAIAQYTVLGTLAGLGFGSLLYMTERNGIVALKDPKPEAFAVDRGAYHIFSRLHRFRSVSREADAAYRMALINTDKLLVLVRALRQGVPPDYDEAYLATGYVQAAKAAGTALLGHLHNGRDRVAAEPIIEDLRDLLQIHFDNVMKICNSFELAGASPSLAR